MCPRKAAPPRPRIWGWIGLLRLPFPARNAATEMWARRRRMRAVDKPLAAAEPSAIMDAKIREGRSGQPNCEFPWTRSGDDRAPKRAV